MSVPRGEFWQQQGWGQLEVGVAGLCLGLEDPKYACTSAGSIASPVPLRKYLHQSHGENKTSAPGEVKHSSKIQWVFWGRIRDKNQDPQGFLELLWSQEQSWKPGTAGQRVPSARHGAEQAC